MKYLALVLSIVSALLLAAGPAFAAEQNLTVTLKVTAPFIGKSALGTLVIHNTGDPSAITAIWSFTGQADGQPASASGLADGRWTGTGYDVTVTRVDRWEMNGIPRPKLPLRMTVRSGQAQTVDLVVYAHTLGQVSTPLRIQGVTGIPAPFGGDLTLSVTNAPGGEVTILPRTGVGDVAATIPTLGIILGAGTALLLGARALIPGRSRRPLVR